MVRDPLFGTLTTTNLKGLDGHQQLFLASCNLRFIILAVDEALAQRSLVAFFCFFDNVVEHTTVILSIRIKEMNVLFNLVNVSKAD